MILFHHSPSTPISTDSQFIDLPRTHDVWLFFSFFSSQQHFPYELYVEWLLPSFVTSFIFASLNCSDARFSLINECRTIFTASAAFGFFSFNSPRDFQQFLQLSREFSSLELRNFHLLSRLRKWCDADRIKHKQRISCFTFSCLTTVCCDFSLQNFFPERMS